MKKFLPIIICCLIGSSLLFNACSKKDNPPAAVLDIDPSKKNITLPASAGKDSILINANESWTVTGMPSWLTVTPASGSGSTTVMLNYTANTTTNTRLVTLTLSSGTGGTSVPINILQLQPNVKIDFFTPHAGGDSLITINGKGFSAIAAENQVKINGGIAQVKTAAITQLTVTVPKKIGSGRVQVTVNTQADTSHTDFKYDWKGIVTVVAGGTQGYLDGTGTNARFDGPAGIKFDAAGNLYVADYLNYKVRKMTPSGVVSTLPGRIPNWNNPTGPNTDFGLPTDIAIDAAGTVYVVEFNSSAISKITASGTVSLLAGSGLNSGYLDGTGTAARFYQPSYIALEPSGNMLVTDTKNHRIRRITTAGVVTTVAGSTQAYADGSGTNAQFNTPFGIALDNAGNYLVADFYNNRIRKLTSAGVVTSFAGSGLFGSADGTLATAQIYQPQAIAVDTQGNIYCGDNEGNSTLRWITPAGDVITITLNTTILSIQGIAVQSDGTIFLSDYNSDRICKLLVI